MIDAYKLVFGVKPICRVLPDHHVPIASSTYYAFKKRPSSARSLSDERIVEAMKEVHHAIFGVYGARKRWHALKRKVRGSAAIRSRT